MTICKPGTGPSSKTWQCWHPELRFPSLQNVRNKFLSLEQPALWQGAWAHCWGAVCWLLKAHSFPFLQILAFGQMRAWELHWEACSSPQSPGGEQAQPYISSIRCKVLASSLSVGCISWYSLATRTSWWNHAEVSPAEGRGLGSFYSSAPPLLCPSHPFSWEHFS